MGVNGGRGRAHGAAPLASGFAHGVLTRGCASINQPRMVLGVDVVVLVEGLAVGVVVARGCSVAAAPAALVAELDATIAAGSPNAEARKGPVRDMLRHGKYKPTGRGKPACEYLLKSALEGRFPRINNLVDALNLVSLRSSLPISVLDLGRTGCTSFVVRRGHEGESFVFNAAGQTIDLRDLLLVAGRDGDTAFANPVKDSMASKLTDASRDVLAVIYAPTALQEAAAQATRALAEGFGAWGGAAEHAHGVVRSSV